MVEIVGSILTLNHKFFDKKKNNSRLISLSPRLYLGQHNQKKHDKNTIIIIIIIEGNTGSRKSFLQ